MELEQIQQEWLLVNAVRELLAIVKRNPSITYSTAIRFADENAPQFFTSSFTKKIRKSSLQRLYDRHKQEAEARSQKEGKAVTTEEIIQEKIEYLKGLLRKDRRNDEFNQLKKEIGRLEDALKEDPTTSLNYERVIEHEAINNDAFLKRIDKSGPDNYLGKFNTYRNKHDKSIFRVAIFHPGRPEIISGVDLVYEQYSRSMDAVRFAAMQYKMWDGEVLYFSSSGDLTRQLEKMEKCICQNGLCLSDEKQNTSDRYRLPYCSAFLRPTDKLQKPNKMVTSGFHLPICRLHQMLEPDEEQPILYKELIRHSALKSHLFEELFNSEMVGSRWIPVSELHELYKEFGILRPGANIILRAQNIERDYQSFHDEDDIF